VNMMAKFIARGLCYGKEGGRALLLLTL